MHTIFRLKNTDAIVGLARDILEQKASILTSISVEDYIRKSPTIYNASIGSHIRHSLNHFQSLMAAHDAENDVIPSIINYDDRVRDSDIENDVQVALSVAREINSKLDSLNFEKPITMSFYGNKASNFQPYSVESNVARELSFVTHHAVHHLAMVTLILQELGLGADQRIGIAMSTLKHQEEPTCKNEKPQ